MTLLSNFLAFLFPPMFTISCYWMCGNHEEADTPIHGVVFLSKFPEVLGALVSVLVIWVLTGVLVYLAIQRILTQDFEINGDVMLITAGVGLGVNIM